ncbi:MAG: hypothetical protein ACLUKN_03915 [Bacilli bacterium]
MIFKEAFVNLFYLRRNIMQGLEIKNLVVSVGKMSDGLSLAARRGGSRGNGPNGTGKSSLSKAIAGHPIIK